MIIKKTINSIQKLLEIEKVNLKKKVAFIPTMGALHDGHLSLIKSAKAKKQFIIVSIYVNPSQFGPNEDFLKYPRSLKSDLKKLKNSKVDLVFTPNSKDLSRYKYKNYNFKTLGLEKKLCGSTRPYHFMGVAEIVLKFFTLLKPDVAYFGEKDYQQFIFIKKIVDQTNLKTKIMMGKTIREKNGLALSSRNKYLKPEEVIIAKNIFKILKETRILIKKNKKKLSILKEQKRKLIACGFSNVEYFQILTNDLKHAKSPYIKSRIFIAARIGSVRLIDNILI